MHIVDKIINNYQTNNDLYIGEKVTTSDHMLQTAMLAEKNHSSKSLICACLLHDYGHFVIEDPDLLVLKSLDGKHEDVGYNFLKDYFKSEVTEPIKLHVQAKRYLCRNKSYFDLLEASTPSSTASINLSLAESTRSLAFSFQSLMLWERIFLVSSPGLGAKIIPAKKPNVEP